MATHTPTQTQTRGCPSWCVGDHADDSAGDSFHDGAAHRITLDGRELVVYPTSATSSDGRAFGGGVVLDVRRGGRDAGDGGVLEVGQVDELVEALQRMREQLLQAQER